VDVTGGCGAKGTLISGHGQRSTDGGKAWKRIPPFPKISSDGWRHDLVALSIAGGPGAFFVRTPLAKLTPSRELRRPGSDQDEARTTGHSLQG
jgi:hypothetical protein